MTHADATKVFFKKFAIFEGKLSSHLDIAFMEVANTKWGFEKIKINIIIHLGQFSFNAN
jgi:hypothetical protein